MKKERTDDARHLEAFAPEILQKRWGSIKPS
jgi:hypothetical protein